MAKCRNCNLEVLDETDTCPLCKSILIPGDPVENMYPDVKVRMRKMKLITNLYLFVAICLELLLIVINIFTTSQIWWSIITGLILLYFYLVLRYAVLGTAGYRSKIFILVLIAILSCVAIDMVIGYQGWSINYVLPFGILLVDVIILGCMFFIRRNWRSYMMFQIMMIICSIIPIVLYLVEWEKHIYLAFLPFVISVLMFVGTLIIGDRKARNELKRRFHI